MFQQLCNLFLRLRQANFVYSSSSIVLYSRNRPELYVAAPEASATAEVSVSRKEAKYADDLVLPRDAYMDSVVYDVVGCLSVCLSHACIVSKQQSSPSSNWIVDQDYSLRTSNMEHRALNRRAIGCLKVAMSQKYAVISRKPYKIDKNQYITLIGTCIRPTGSVGCDTRQSCVYQLRYFSVFSLLPLHLY